MTRPEALDVRRLATRRDCVSGEVGRADLPRLADRLVGAAAIGYRLCGVADARGRPAAELELRGSVEVACDLCDAPVAVALDSTPRPFYFVADDAELDAIPVDPAEEAEPLVAGNVFDLAQLLEDEILLALPISPRHATCPEGRPRAEPAAGPAAAAPAAAPTRRALAGLGALWKKARDGADDS